jgi:hypothetical protein
MVADSLKLAISQRLVKKSFVPVVPLKNRCQWKNAW